jgi:ParB family chromosome partitioning protein|tara:strand:+ start:1196 stop:2023 length:828 start_codon:yes stop_codon:yes gene_type:complete
MSKAQVTDTKEIPLSKLVIGKAQVRTREVGVEIDELATNIRERGLLQPIVVGPPDINGKYEIILGQRRFLAHERLDRKKIRAAILSKNVDEMEAKIISLSENMMRRDLKTGDLKDVCTFLYSKYLSMKDVAEKTGLPYDKVRTYVKVERLPEKIKKAVETNEIDPKDALDAWDAVFEQEDQIDKALSTAKEFKKLNVGQKSSVKRILTENPQVKVSKAVDMGKRQTTYSVTITQGPRIHEALQTYGNEQNMPLDEAASELVEEGLISAGLLGEDD